MFRPKIFKKKRNFRRKIILISTIAVFIFALIYCDTAVDGIINPLVIKNAEEIINYEINATVRELLSCNEFKNRTFIAHSSDNTERGAVTVNAALLNKFKTSAINLAQQKLAKHKNLVTYVQLGSLTPSAFLSNRGPDIPVYFDFYCSVNANIDTSVSQSEINRVLHTVTLNMVTKFSIVLLNGEYNSQINSDFIVCETLLSGNVPNYYGALIGGTKE